MRRTSWASLALFGLLAQAGFAWCQADTTAFLQRPAAYVLPPLGQVPEIAPIVTPYVDDSPNSRSGLFTNLELFLLRPHLGSHLIGSPNQGADTVVLTTQGPFGTFLSPRFEMGYRLPEQLGEFSLRYRFEIADRNLVPVDNLGGISQKDRLNLNVVDLDWSHGSPFALDPGWDLRFNVGVRFITIFFDTQRNFGAEGNVAGQTDERATNNFWGLGPEVGFSVSREIFIPGLAIMGKAAGADLFGSIRQSYSQTKMGAGGPAFARDESTYQVGVPTLAVQAGLTYSPPQWNGCRFSAGYLWEEFWQIGRLGDSGGALLNRGVFFRAEFTF